jgi:hypothetical protein
VFDDECLWRKGGELGPLFSPRERPKEMTSE